MARQNEAKVKFSADTKQFNDEIKSANAAMSGLRGELKLNQAQMKNAGESVDGLTRSKKLLEQQELALQQKVTALSSKLEASNRAFGEGSAESQKLTNQLNAARTAQERVKGQIEQTSQAIERQKAAESQAESAYSQLSAKISEQKSRLAQLEREYADAVLAKGKDSAEAQKLGASIQELSRDLRQSEGRMQDAEGAARDLASSLDKVEKESGDAKNSLGELAAGTMVADFAKQGIDSVLGLCDATEEFQAHMTQLETTFQNSGRTVDDANRVYKKFLGLCGDSDQAIEAAQDMNNLADAGADIDRWYDIAAGTVSAFGDALPVENLIESANETIRTGQVTGGLADALNWTSVNLDDLNAKLGEAHPEAMAAFNEAIDGGLSTEDALNAAFEQCSDSAERQQILTELLSGQYTELGQSFEDANGDIIEARNASAELESAQADLAEKVRPLQTDLKMLASEGIAFLTDNIDWLIPVAISAAAALGIFAVAMGFESICAAATGGVAAFGGALSSLAANPVALVIAAIGLLVALFVYLVATNEGFRDSVMDGWGQITAAVQAAMSILQPYLSSAWAAVQETVTTAMEYIVPYVAAMLSLLLSVAAPLLEGLLSLVAGLFGSMLSTVAGVLDGIVSIVTGVLMVMQGLFETAVGLIVGLVTGDFSMMSDGVSTVMTGLLSILSGAWNTILSVIAGILNSILSAISSSFNAAAGVASGVFGTIASVIGDKMGDAQNVVSGALNAISGFFSGLHLEFPHINLPHFHISGSFSLDPPSMPSITVDWYAKGGVLNAPTIFGASGGRLLGGGEAGPEAVAPIAVLQGYVTSAVSLALDSGIERVVSAVDRLGDRVTVLEVDGREFARATAGPRDRVDGSRQSFADRGLATT